MAAPGINYDVTIGGYGFFYAIDDQNPHVRQTNNYRRQQIDTSPEPGEQTLSQWWVRSQDSWHRGQGILNYEPGNNKETEYRYATGYNVYPWDQSSIRLSTDFGGGGANSSWLVTGTYNNTAYYWSLEGTNLFANAVTSTGSIISSGYAAFPSTPRTEPALAGNKLLIGGTSVIMVANQDPAVSNVISNLWTAGPAATTCVPYWAKNRIICAAGSSLYELTLAGGVFPAATFTPATAGGTWTAVAEAPDCILAAYNAGGKGYIYCLRLIEPTTAGGSPTLGAFVQVAEMPPGEMIYSMRTYLGAYVVLGTSLGVRICSLGSGSEIAVGPLTVKTTNPVYALTARDNFVYAGITADAAINNLSGVVRIDLGQEILNYTLTGYASKTLRYAYNYDWVCSVSGSGWEDNQVQSIGALGLFDIVYLGLVSGGIYSSGPGRYPAANGVFTTGRIRYGTTENKTFAYLKLGATIPANTSIVVDVITPSGSVINVATLTSATDLTQDIPLTGVSSSVYPWIQVRFTLNTNTTVPTRSYTPTIDSYQVKATPLPHIQRQIMYPLRLADFEQDSKGGLVVGYKDSAYSRLAALETLENNQSLVTVVDNTNGETFTGIIQQIQFLRDTPPSRNLKNYGGRVNVMVLKI
jgi:hypothetical protein